MSATANDLPSPLARWCSRLAVFSLALIAATLVLHRGLGLPTAAAFNLLGVAYVLCMVAVLCGIGAAIGIWRTGRAGTARVVVGSVLAGMVLASPLALLVLARDYPMINDVTTDPERPPAFTALASARSSSANPAAYPGAGFAVLQRAAYPDLKPILVNRPPAETFDLVVEALKRLHFTIAAEEPPSETVREGFAEAVDRTLILGFYDDVAVRVSEAPGGSRIDLRSASRYGRSDFGRNAERLREIMREIVARLEATVPAAEEDVEDTPNKKNVKRPKDADQNPAGSRKKSGDAPPDTRRAP